MITLVIALLLGGFIAQFAVTAEARPQCTKMEERRALDEAGKGLRSWMEVYSSYKRFAHCDDGAIAEGYSDSVVRLLAHNWAGLATLVALTRSDKAFEAFVLRDVDATANPDDLKLVVDNAGRRCEPAAARLCPQIKQQAADALKDIAALKGTR